MGAAASSGWWCAHGRLQAQFGQVTIALRCRTKHERSQLVVCQPGRVQDEAESGVNGTVVSRSDVASQRCPSAGAKAHRCVIGYLA